MSSLRREVAAIAKRPENLICADCETQNPQWASFNLGVFICMNCAGVHRSMGTHISKVRSVTLDEWDRAAVTLMSQVGNTKGNSYWECHLSQQQKQRIGILAGPAADTNVRNTFIRDKYERRTWYGQPSQAQADGGSASATPSAEPTREQRRQQRLEQRRAASSRGAATPTPTTNGASATPAPHVDTFPSGSPAVTRSASAPSFPAMKSAEQHHNAHHTHNGHTTHEPSAHDVLAQQLFAGLNVSPVHHPQSRSTHHNNNSTMTSSTAAPASAPRPKLEKVRAASPWVSRPPVSQSPVPTTPMTAAIRTASAPNPAIVIPTNANSAPLDLFSGLNTAEQTAPTPTPAPAPAPVTGGGGDLFSGLTEVTQRANGPANQPTTNGTMNLMSFAEPAPATSSFSFLSEASAPSLQPAPADLSFSMSNVHIRTEASPLDAFMQASNGVGVGAGANGFSTAPVSTPVPVPVPVAGPPPVSSPSDPVDLFADIDEHAMAATTDSWNATSHKSNSWNDNSESNTWDGTNNTFNKGPGKKPSRYDMYGADTVPSTSEPAPWSTSTSTSSPGSAFSFVGGPGPEQGGDPFGGLPTAAETTTTLDSHALFGNGITNNTHHIHQQQPQQQQPPQAHMAYYTTPAPAATTTSPFGFVHPHAHAHAPTASPFGFVHPHAPALAPTSSPFGFVPAPATTSPFAFVHPQQVPQSSPPSQQAFDWM